MQKFSFRNSPPAKVAKPAKATANEGYPVANQLLKVANVIGSDNGKAETLADISKSLAGQDTSKDNDLSKNSKISSTSGAIPENNNPIPPPELPGMGAEYNRIWNQAWILADWIDNPDGASLAERRAKLPDLMQLRDRMAEIENTGGLVIDDPPRLVKPKDTGTWTKWEPASGRDPIIPETCPARGKNSGKCYARAYFEGKPGKAKNCEPDGCKWITSGKEVNK